MMTNIICFILAVIFGIFILTFAPKKWEEEKRFQNENIGTFKYQEEIRNAQIH